LPRRWRRSPSRFSRSLTHGQRVVFRNQSSLTTRSTKTTAISRISPIF
jgi:hypothetical protein